MDGPVENEQAAAMYPIIEHSIYTSLTFYFILEVSNASQRRRSQKQNMLSLSYIRNF